MSFFPVMFVNCFGELLIIIHSLLLQTHFARVCKILVAIEIKIKQNKSHCKVRYQNVIPFPWQLHWPQVGALFSLMNKKIYVKNFVTIIPTNLECETLSLIFQIISFQIGEDSGKCRSCGAKMSAYFCAICKHFTSIDKNPYHCEKCGICR